jgi:hypothetical protein
MNPNRLFSRVALPALLLAATALPGWAQGDAAAALPRVDVTTPSLGAHAVCPEFVADMRKALAQVAMRHRAPALLDVNFEIDGSRIGEVIVAGGPFDYRRATQRAVHSLDCDNGNAGQRTVHMQVVFKDL